MTDTNNIMSIVNTISDGNEFEFTIEITTSTQKQVDSNIKSH